ncbi:MAG: tetratricopeptide repeat protein [Candidatus Hodarchaeales archaeon]|jgi:tetratricopeptide (TPR) repeat protein
MPVSTIKEFSKAIDLLMDQNVKESLTLFKNISGVQWVVECLSQLKLHNELIDYYENNVKLEEKLPVKFYLRVAEAYKSEKRLIEAKKILLNSLEIEKTARAYLLLTDIFITEEKPKNALQSIKNAQVLMKDKIDNFKTYELLGDYYHLEDEYEKAIEEYNKAESLKMEKNRVIEFFQQHSYLELKDGNILTSFRPFENVVEKNLPLLKKNLIETRSDDTERSKILNRLGNYYAMKGDYDKASHYFKQALESSTTNEKLVSFILNNQAIVDVKRGDYKAAIIKMNESYSKLKVLGIRIEIAYCLNNLAKIYELSGKIREAKDIYLESLEMLREYNDGRGTTVVLLNLANHARLRGQVKEGLEYYYRAYKSFQGDKTILALLLQSISELYWAAGCHDIALKRSKQAQEIYERLKIKDFYYCYNQLLQSGIFTDLDQLDDARALITAVEEFNKNLKSKALEANVFLRKGVIEQKQRNYGNAEMFFEQVPIMQFLPHIESLFHSAEIKSVEYLTSMDERYFEETVLRIKSVIEKAEESNFYQLLSESLLLMSTLEAVRLNYDEAINRAEISLDVARKNGLYEQLQRANSRLERLKVKFRQTKLLLESQQPDENDMQEFHDYLEKALSLVKTRRSKNE